MNRLKSSITFALLLVFLSVGIAEAQAIDPVVVRVGKVEYRRSEVQAYWDSLAEYMLAVGDQINAGEQDAYAQSVVESYVGMGVIENKLAEFGLDKLSADDHSALEAEALRLYSEALEIYTQRVMSQYNRTHDEAEPYAKNFMELDGYTMQETRAQALRNLKEERILNYISGNVAALTDAELDNYYQQNMVSPSKAAYEGDIAAFENDVLLYGGNTYWIPEGYRYIRHIFFAASEETREKAAGIQEELVIAEADLETAENKLYGARLLNENVETAEDELRQAKALCNDLRTQLDLIYAETLSLYAEQIADVRARLASGESFEALMKEYTQDQLMPEEGFMISAESVMWEVSFKQGAMALTAIGQVSEPVVGPSGVHIMEYTGDAPSGVIPLEGELKETVAESALLERKYNLLSAYLARWRLEYDIETHPTLLETPSCLLAK